MTNPKAHLSKHVLDREKLESVPLRNGFGEGLVIAGKKDERVVALCADLTDSTRTNLFRDAFPDRFVEMGVAEQNLATVASGMANYGKIPFITSYAAFSPGRNNEQIRTTIALANLPVKIAGSHAGISVGPDGATHQALEDAGLLRLIPNMTVILPCDAIEARKATVAAATTDGPVYVRLAREGTPVFTTEKTPFVIGRAEVYRFGHDVAFIGAGPVLHNAILAAEVLKKEYGIEAEVVNLHTIKPVDNEAVVAAAKKCKCVVSVEEHQVTGGVGSAVAEVLARHYPVPQEFVGVQDRFGESGNPEELIEAFGMGSAAMVEAARKVFARKKRR